MATTIFVLAVTALGLMAGALLAEAAILVPFWRSLPAESFLSWYRDHGALLLRFFGPIEVAAVLLAALATVTSWLSGGSGTLLLAVASVLSLVLLAMFPLYFKEVNSSFAAGTIPPENVREELRRWARWHWARVVIAIAAFLSAVLSALAGA